MSNPKSRNLPKTEKTPGPLPAGWHINPPYGHGYMEREDGAQSYILDKSGKIDRNEVATILENYGYNDHAKRWSMDAVHAAAPELLEALRELLDGYYERLDAYNDQEIEEHFPEIIKARNLLAKIEGA